jgi:hypothetical protein
MEVLIDTMTFFLAKKAASEAATYAGLNLSYFIGRGRHIGITCDGWYRYSGERHDYDSDEVPDLV